MARSMNASLRWAVLERDAFTCRYCGRSAPQVVLHVDHVKPRSAGGEDSFENLVTACQDCNLGKSTRDSREAISLVVRLQQAEFRLLEWEETGDIATERLRRVELELDDLRDAIAVYRDLVSSLRREPSSPQRVAEVLRALVGGPE